ncbi:hypothetical protein SAMN05660976_05892 [Nonomuraea pusilla]|uniref:CBM2 domain-containing protein n=2 Tax=Nonomuraea pusilla TaxID=46177 RepID=A0A1H8APX1_9ACTN|nr:hypothetical protein SAMN05660976_05892 [Nonomuraea pusilla]
MGRHGTGGSDDGEERGSGSAFWGPDEQPGWPAPPDQPAVTGQWAPMPRHDDDHPRRTPSEPSEPFETTGAYALPTDAGTGLPPTGGPTGLPPSGGSTGLPPSGGPGSAPLRPDPLGTQAGPFETTGAFAIPPDWDAARPGSAPGSPGPAPQGPAPFGEPGAPFGAPGHTAVFGTAPFGDPERTAAFGTGPSGDPERTAAFDSPSGPTSVYGGPPEPGDVKVAGTPAHPPTPAPTPAWAEAETGFLTSGWSEDDGALDEPEPRRGRGRRRESRGRDDGAPPSGGGRGGKGKLALLSVAAVVVVLGGTVMGVNLLSSSDDAGACTGSACTAVSTSAGPATGASDPAEETEPAEEPTDEPTEEPTEDDDRATPSTAPTAPNTSGVRPSRRPTPTPSKTKVPTSHRPTRPPTRSPAEDTASDAPTDTASPLGDGGTGVVPTVGSEQQPTPSQTATNESAPSGGSVNVRQTVRQRGTDYTAKLRVSNVSRETLENPTLSVPVEGRVQNVSGGTWTQDGDLLIIDLSASLATGDSAEVTFTATGDAEQPGACGLVGGQCSVA